ncbi:hypothetical protein [Pseudooceanicola nanhaiensis]|uniref:hypothetical protein n=1 Tax=Pseudooceanicola nanhaiensis TaxID=375761 RepID=UPI003515E1EB
MKPHFALSLSMDGIALFHRAPAGWDVVGEVPLDSANLPAELARLRGMAERLRPGPALCKIVVPNDQIRYMHIATGWADNGERTAMVEAALDGATPYELDELSYVCAISGETTHVAAVARETLDEAEEFATSHGFAPVSFVAMPEKGDFLGEPFFGETAAARMLLATGERVEPDYLAIAVVGRARVPAAPEDGGETHMAGTTDTAAAPGQAETGTQSDGPEAVAAAADAAAAADPDASAQPEQAAASSARTNTPEAGTEGASIEPTRAESGPSDTPGENEADNAGTAPEPAPSEPVSAKAPTDVPSKPAGPVTPGTGTPETARPDAASEVRTATPVHPDGTAPEEAPDATASPATAEPVDIPVDVEPLVAEHTDPAASAPDEDPRPAPAGPLEGARDASADESGPRAASPFPADAPLRPSPEPAGPAPHLPETDGLPDRAALLAPEAEDEDSAPLPLFRRPAEPPQSPGATPSGRPRPFDAPELPSARITPLAAPETPAPAFTSVRARRDAPESAAPQLAGVTRGAAPGPDAAPRASEKTEPPVKSAQPAKAAPPAPSEPPATPEPPLSREAPSTGALAVAASLSRMALPEDEEPEEPAPEFLSRKRPPEPVQTRAARGGLGGMIARLKRPARQEPTIAAPVATAPAAPEPAAPRATPLVASAGREAREAEAARMTVFGARPSQVVAKPRYLGLLLTLILVLFMMGVAAWASIFMSDEVSDLLRPDARTQIAGNAPESPPADAISGLATEEERAEETDGDATELALAETVEPMPRQDALPQPSLREPVRPRAPSEQPRSAPPVAEVPDAEDEARYAATGVWVSAPWVAPAPIPGTTEDLYIASIDPDVPNLDAVALPVPEAERGDMAPGTVFDPAPPGTTFRIGEDGFVVPTPEGALTPDGVLVRAGPPERVPGPRPAETRLDAPGLTAADRVDMAVELAALQSKRPRLRPGGLVEENERGKLGGFSRQELAAYRPKARPALPDARQEAEDAAETEIDTGTAQAVGTSRRPRPRPSEFAVTVAAAQAAAIKPVAVVAPSQPVAVQPRIPSNTSVTKTATVRNAINLNAINLIGVYGQPSSRRALVRMSDGRYRKVKVGDTLDGGRVSAIGDGQLSYTKGGRNHTLVMPKG